MATEVRMIRKLHSSLLLLTCLTILPGWQMVPLFGGATSEGPKKIYEHALVNPADGTEHKGYVVEATSTAMSRAVDQAPTVKLPAGPPLEIEKKANNDAGQTAERDLEIPREL